MQETLEHGRNCVKVDLLIVIRLLAFCYNFKLFFQETSGMGCFTKTTETKDRRLIGSIEELAVSVKQHSLSQRKPLY